MTNPSRLQLGLIGAGHWGPNLLRNFASLPLVTVKYVVEPDSSRAKRVGDAHPDVIILSHHKDLLADPSVAAVVIATPTSTHAALVRAALEAGKHVLVEKPLTNSVADAEALCALAKARGLILMVGHVYLFNRATAAAKDYLRDGRLGQLRYITFTRTNFGPIRSDVNASWDLAAHDVSMALDWLGMPSRLLATGGAWVRKDLHDAVFVTMRYPDSVLVHVHCSWLSPQKNRSITIVGDQAMLTVDDLLLSEPIRIYDRAVAREQIQAGDSFTSFYASAREGDITIPPIRLDEPLRLECEHFVAMVRQQTEVPRVDARFGVDVVRVLAAIDEALRTGEEVQL